MWFNNVNNTAVARHSLAVKGKSATGTYDTQEPYWAAVRGGQFAVGGENAIVYNNDDKVAGHIDMTLSMHGTVNTTTAGNKCHYSGQSSFTYGGTGPCVMTFGGQYTVTSTTGFLTGVYIKMVATGAAYSTTATGVINGYYKLTQD